MLQHRCLQAPIPAAAIPYPVRAQGEETFGSSDRVPPLHGEPMSMCQQPRSWTEATLNKDSRRGQGHTQEARPNSESRLAREPAPQESDRVERPPSPKKSITLSLPTTSTTPSTPSELSSSHPLPPCVFFTSTSASKPLSLSLSASHYPPSPSSRNCPCPISTPIMPVATLSSACSQSPTTKDIKSPLDCTSSPSVLASSLQTPCYGSECGRLLARHSRTGLNRLLDSVMDNAATLAESNSRHRQYPDHDICGLSLPDSTSAIAAASLSTTAMQQRPFMAARLSSKAKFFVCDEESEDESEEDREDQWVGTGVPFVEATSICGFVDRQDHDSEHSDWEDQGKDKDKDVAWQDIRFSQQPSVASTSGVARRQSLLSNLFMAEKLLATQKGSCGTADSETAVWTSMPLSRYHSATKSERDISFSGPTVGRQLHQTITGLEHQPIQTTQRQPDNRQSTQQHNGLHSTNIISGRRRASTSSLRRTQPSVFKKLDELAVDTAVTHQKAGTVAFLPQMPASQHTTLSATVSKAVFRSRSKSTSSPPIFATPPTSTTICKTTLVTIPPQPASSLIASVPQSPLKSHPNQNNHSTLPSTANSYCYSPATATTKTAFATASATSNCMATTSSASAATVAAAAAVGTGEGSSYLGWPRIHHAQAYIHSFYGQLTSSIQRAISTLSAT